MSDPRTRYRVSAVAAILFALAAAGFAYFGLWWPSALMAVLTIAALVTRSHYQMVLLLQGMERRINRAASATDAKLDAAAAVVPPPGAWAEAAADLRREIIATESLVLADVARVGRLQRRASLELDAALAGVRADVAESAESLGQIGETLAGFETRVTSLISVLQEELALARAERGDTAMRVEQALQAWCEKVLEASERVGVARGEDFDRVLAEVWRAKDEVTGHLRDELWRAQAEGVQHLVGETWRAHSELAGKVRGELSLALDQHGHESRQQLVSELAAVVSGATETQQQRVDSAVREVVAELTRLSEKRDGVNEDLWGRVERLLGDFESAQENAQSHFNALQSKLVALRVADEQMPQSVAGYLELRSLLIDEPAELPDIGGWAVTAPTLGTLAWRVLDSPEPLTVVELGSGTSSVWIGLAMKFRGMGHCWSVDSDPEFADRTREALRRFGVEDWVTVVDAPLVPIEDGGGELWYDPSALPDVADIGLLFVDGPTASYSLARYPAFGHFRDRLADGAWVVLDDTIRVGERTIFERWCQEGGDRGTLRRDRDLGKSWLGIWSGAEPR